MSDIDKFLSDSFGAVQETVSDVATSAKENINSFLERFSSGNTQATTKSQQAAVASSKALSVEDVMPRLIQAESLGVHMDAKGKLTTSKAGAEGITQLMPTTAKKPGYGIEPAKDKSEAEYLRVGKAYLQKMYDKFGDWEKALAAYDAGVGNVIKAEGKAERFGGDWKEHLPKKEETLPYIKRILGGIDAKKRGIQEGG